MEGYESSVALLKALSDETRLSILDMLAQGERCACRIQDEFRCTQPTISYHMRILIDAGLVTCRREGSMTCYRVNEREYQAVCRFIAEMERLAEEKENE